MKIKTFYGCFKEDKEMDVGFIVILTKQTTTFSQQVLRGEARLEDHQGLG